MPVLTSPSQAEKVYGSINYKQPPAAFYNKIFSLRTWTRIIFVTSADAPTEINPVWFHFLNSSYWPNDSPPRIFQMSTTIQEDMRTLWCARYYVSARSSLSDMIAATSPFLLENYATSHCSAIKSGVKCRRFNIDHYHYVNWTNSPEQREALVHVSDPALVSELDLNVLSG